MTMDGEPVEVSPRQILRRQIERAASPGSRSVRHRARVLPLPRLLRRSRGEAVARLEPHADTIEDYQLLQTSREEYVIGRIRNQMIEAGIPVEFSKGEAGPGQHEINITYSRGTRGGRPSSGLQDRSEGDRRSGRSSGNLHGQVVDGQGRLLVPPPHEPVGRRALRTAHGPRSREGTDSGFSRVGEQFLAGQLPAAGELAWCFAPYVNSYRRFVPDSWAPTAVVWGEDNRTCGLRAVGTGSARRMESRIPGADVNPYIALAAAIAGGLWGIEHELELEPGLHRQRVPGSRGPPHPLDAGRVPSTLLAGSKVAAEAFGAEVHQHLLNTARQEWYTANRVVTDWELARNFERI